MDNDRRNASAVDDARVSEQFTKAIVDAAKQIGKAILFFVMSALSVATDPFFRKNMGERYFNPFKALVGLAGWMVAGWSASVSYDVLQGKRVYHQPDLTLSISVCCCYLVLSVAEIWRIRTRSKRGEIWHSQSKGESIFGIESFRRDILINITLCVAMWNFSKVLMGYFAVSRLLGYAADAATRASLYNKYLDILDAKIESRFMSEALDGGFPPGRTAGFYRPLPTRFNRQQKANIARVLAGSRGPQNTAEDAAGIQPESEHSQPRSHEQKKVPSVSISAVASVFIRTILSSRLFRYCIIIGVIAVGALYVRNYIRRLDQVKETPSDTQQSPPSPATPVHSSENSVVPLRQQPILTATNAKPVIAPATTGNIVRIQTDLGQKQMELQSPEQIRALLIQQINDKFDAQLAEVAFFKSNCVNRFDANTKKIAKLGSRNRNALETSYDQCRKIIMTTLENEEGSLNRSKRNAQGLDDLNSNAEGFRDQLDELVSNLRKDRQVLSHYLDMLDAQISAASKR